MKIINKLLDFWQNIDYIILLLLIILGGFGIIMVYSATSGDIGYTDRKIIQVLMGIAIFVIVSNIKYTIIESIALPALIITIILLIYTMLFGVTSKGATRWISLGFVRFQPSEFAKITVSIFLSIYLGSKTSKLKFKHIAVSFILLLIPSLLIIKQPDLGTGILVISSGIIVIFLSGLPWKYIWFFIILAIIIAPLIWNFGLHDYQKERIYVLLNPSSDPLGTGYHVNQSKIAIGSGGIFGKGLLLGTQVQLNFLPESHTDFIFSVLGEELGVVGVAVLFILYLAVVFRLYYLATKSNNQTARLLCSSLGFIFSIYVIVNTGMVSGLLPVVGVPLPFISYGGTALVSLCVTFGIVIGYYKQTLQSRQTFNSANNLAKIQKDKLKITNSFE